MTVRRFAALNYFVETVQGFQMQGHSTGREKARGLAVSEQRGYSQKKDTCTGNGLCYLRLVW